MTTDKIKTAVYLPPHIYRAAINKAATMGLSYSSFVSKTLADAVLAEECKS